MKISVDYYKLKEDKKMGDGTMIPKGQELIFVKKDGNHTQFEFVEDNCTTLFWATDKEVSFVNNKEEDWSFEKINQRNRYINGELL